MNTQWAASIPSPHCPRRSENAEIDNGPEAIGKIAATPTRTASHNSAELAQQSRISRWRKPPATSPHRMTGASQLKRCRVSSRCQSHWAVALHAFQALVWTTKAAMKATAAQPAQPRYRPLKS